METPSPSPLGGPLAGVLVLDFGQAAVGPVAASYMAMLGATVIKIESPGGDLVRAVHPWMNEVSTTYIGNNVGKFGIVIDLKSETGRTQARSLIARADVVIDNFRSPEVMMKLGLDYFTVMREINPGIVYVQSSAFGVTGPWSGMFSFELIAQACSGFAAVTGADGGLPEVSRGTSYLDWNGAMINLVAMLAGLYRQRSTGEGMMLETSQLASAVFTGMDRLIADGAEAAPTGSTGSGYVPDRVFAAADGEVAISAPSDAAWQRLCRGIGRRDLARDPDLRTAAGRMKHRTRVEREVAGTVSGVPISRLLADLRAARVACAEHVWGQTISERMLSHPQVQANRMLVEQPSRYGPVLTQTPHWKFRDHVTDLYRPSPALGEHSDLVRALVQAGNEPQVEAAASPLEWSPVLRSVESERVLSGVRVLEIGSGLAVATGGMMLGALGAGVVKLESPAGDWLRGWGGEESQEALWDQTARGKTIRACDLTAEDGQDILRRQIQEADVVLVGGPIDSRDRLGITPDAVRRMNPAAVYCGITGWGPEGPMRDLPATELDVEVATGMTLQLGRAGGPPIRQGFQVVSINTGIAAAQASLAALIARGGGQGSAGDHVEVSLLHTAVAISQCNVTAESETDDHKGFQVEAYRWRPDHGFATKDGRVYIALGPAGSNWTTVLEALGRSDLLIDERFSTPALALANDQELKPLIEQEFSERTTAELEQLIRWQLGGAIVPILSPQEVVAHPQVVALDLVRSEGGRRRIDLPIRRVVARIAQPEQTGSEGQ